MRSVMVGMAAAVLLSAMPARADVKAGVDAWTRGDYRVAVEQWRPLAVAGDADAQFNLGQAYKLGRGVPEDPAMAESWFRRAALQNHQQAEDNYGLALFQNGRKAEAVPWLEKSAARGEARGQLVLGTMLFNGDGIARDPVRAYALMTRASAQGLRPASETLAQMDQHVAPADREKGVVLARQMESQARLAPTQPDRTAVRATDAPAAVSAATGMRRGDPLKVEGDPMRTTPARLTPAAPRAVPSPRPQPAKPTPAPVIAVPGKPAATPPPARPAAPVATAARGAYRVQLGAFRDAGNARALWSRVGARVGGAASYPVAGGVTRLQAGPFRTRGEAQAACRKSGVSCVVIAR